MASETIQCTFRLAYATRPGQNLVLELSWEEQVGIPQGFRRLPMEWRDHGHWQLTVELPRASSNNLHWRYLLEEQWNGCIECEWGKPRHALLSQASEVLFIDSWRSAGSLEAIFQCQAFQQTDETALQQWPLALDQWQARLHFVLQMAAVPPGKVPCIVGSVAMLGSWDWQAALPLSYVGNDLWHCAVSVPTELPLDYKYGIYERVTGRVECLEEGANRQLEAGRPALTVIHDEGFARTPAQRLRYAGVAVPVFSLRTAQSGGVGEFADLTCFGQWAAEAGLSIIQILPVNDTSSTMTWRDSYPYAAISVHALHPLYLRLEDLTVKLPEIPGYEANKARLNALPELDYEGVMAFKMAALRATFAERRAEILLNEQFAQFVEANRWWLKPYAMFCVHRDTYGTADYTQWPTPTPEPSSLERCFYEWLQYELDCQFLAAVASLRECGLVLKGDLPIGIHRHSADAWANPELFCCEAQAGAPPDAFAERGQNWGFPTYRWQAMAATDYSWWQSRLQRLSRYFDAFRIDHILGFFRIWQVPIEHVEGIMGFFDPALPFSIEEIEARGIPWDQFRYTKPYLRDYHLGELFGEYAEKVKQELLEECGHGYLSLRACFSTQRDIARWHKQLPEDHWAKPEWLLERFFEIVSEVLLLEEPTSNGRRFHPRIELRKTRSFAELPAELQWRFRQLHDDYFYRRHEVFWEASALSKLPALRAASTMLLCGEDLGMVPACVPGVMQRLGILSLEIERMPKDEKQAFFDLLHAPYTAVVSPGTHDMATLRGWWQEDEGVRRNYARTFFGLDDAPAELTAELAYEILARHMRSPAMLAIVPLQDFFALDSKLRHVDVASERINVPAICPYYWKYRSHLSVEELMQARAWTASIRQLVVASGRATPAMGSFHKP